VNRATPAAARGITDFLTGWHNRRYLQQRLKEELAARAQRRGGNDCLPDGFRHRQVSRASNDGYGHLGGRQCAQRGSRNRIRRRKIRTMDTAARFGGDELAILLPEATAA